ncbi:MAG TPA: hypothetical protein VGG51_13415 [Candidatus Cybelea sp.]|jgi:hypothetical protein
MTHEYTIVLLAMGHAEMAVAQDLAARYCPHSKAVFSLRLWAIFAGFVAAVLVLFWAANRYPKRSLSRTQLYVAAGALLLFAIGAGALVLYGLSGCSGTAAEGLIWDWP